MINETPAAKNIWAGAKRLMNCATSAAKRVCRMPVLLTLKSKTFTNGKNICVKNSRRAGRHKAFSYRLSCFLFARFLYKQKGECGGQTFKSIWRLPADAAE